MQQRETQIETLTNNTPTQQDTTNALQQSPPQLPMQNAPPQSLSDNELVDDILNEINTANTPSQSNADEKVESSEFTQHMDNTTSHALQPSSSQDLQDYQNKVDIAESQDTLSEGERLLRAQRQTTEPKSFLESFDMIQFAKTLLLTMILFIVVTNSHTQKLLCKLPFICTTTMVEGVASTQLNFMGTILMAFLCGIVLSSAQAFL